MIAKLRYLKNPLQIADRLLAQFGLTDAGHAANALALGNGSSAMLLVQILLAVCL